MYITCNMLWTSLPSFASLQLSPGSTPQCFSLPTSCAFANILEFTPCCLHVQWRGTLSWNMVSPLRKPWSSLMFLMSYSEIFTVKTVCHNSQIFIRLAIKLVKLILKQNASDLCHTLLASNVSGQGNCMRWHTSNDSWVPHREHCEIGVSSFILTRFRYGFYL